VVAIVLTPHQSTLGSGQYVERAEGAASDADRPMHCVAVPSWHRAPGLDQLLADRTRQALAALDADRRRRTSVLFTAHSLPLRAVADDDPYPRQVAESAAGVAALLGLDAEPGLTWGVAWQSAGRTGDQWLGPDLLGEMRRAAAEGATAVVVVPVGFVSDHLEILYDLDVEARGLADSLGLGFARTRSLNDDPRLSAILADVVELAADSTPPA
jgi:ferrochelatase